MLSAAREQQCCSTRGGCKQKQWVAHLGWVVALCGVVEAVLVTAPNGPQQIALHGGEEAASAHMHPRHLHIARSQVSLHQLLTPELLSSSP